MRTISTFDTVRTPKLLVLNMRGCYHKFVVRSGRRATRIRYDASIFFTRYLVSDTLRDIVRCSLYFNSDEKNVCRDS